MDRILLLIQDVGDPRLGGADSFCDRLNCRYTVSLLAVFALMVTTRQYVGEPISCWCPSDFTSSNVDFVNKVCWTTSTYFLEFDVLEIPKENDPRRKVSYYQWVSVILVCQAVMFYVPRALWRVFNKKSGIAVHSITDAAIERQRKSDPESADKIMRFIVKSMGRFLLELNRDAKNTANTCSRDCFTKLAGNYLFALYVAMKLLYLGNVVGQFLLLNSFLSTDFHWYGFEVMKKIVSGENWATSHRFPRITMCDFKIRVLGNIHRHTVQCSLPMNLLNEIFFIFLWFWFWFVGVATVISLIIWLITSISIPYQVSFMRSRLYAMDRVQRKQSKTDDRIERFVVDYLRRDGCFIVRLVAKNTSDLIAAELISGLWDHFRDNRKKIEIQQSEENALECNDHINDIIT